MTARFPGNEEGDHMSELRLTYNVDMVFCIDSTGSMGPVIGQVKRNALKFYDDVSKAMREKNKVIDTLRVKVISFRDYIADEANADAMQTTDFFDLPAQSEDFERCISSIDAHGGGDEPEDGLEALAYAIRSDWMKQGTKRRSVIVVWTDASTHDLGYGKDADGYPKGMPGSFDELTRWWGDPQNEPYIRNSAKRLVLFAPNMPWWSTIANNWNNVIYYPSTAGNGLQEIDYTQIIDCICNSI